MVSEFKSWRKANQRVDGSQVTERTKLYRKSKMLDVMFPLLIMFILDGQAKGDETHPRACDPSLGTLLSVEKCPVNKEEWQSRASTKACQSFKQNCSSTSEFQYHCLLDGTGTRLVEVCAPVYHIVGRLCAEFNIHGKVIQNRLSASCETFHVPCGFRYFSNMSYQYQDCYTYVKSTTTQHTTDTTWFFNYTTKGAVFETTAITDTDTSERDILILVFGVALPLIFIEITLYLCRRRIFNGGRKIISLIIDICKIEHTDEEVMALIQSNQEQLSGCTREEISILYWLLFSENYSVDLGLKNVAQLDLFYALYENTCGGSVCVRDLLLSVKSNDNITERTIESDDKLTFASKEAKDEVFLHFISKRYHFKKDKIEFFLKTASVAAVKEYCRSTNYIPKEDEICICLQDTYTDLFITKMNLNLITHCSIEDKYIHQKISQLLRVSSDILLLDQGSRAHHQEELTESSVHCVHTIGILIGCSRATIARKNWKQIYSTEEFENNSTCVMPPVVTFEVLDAQNCLKGVNCDTIKYFCLSDSIDGTEKNNSMTADENPTGDQQLSEIRGLNLTNIEKKLLSLRMCSSENYPSGCLEIYLNTHTLPILMIDMSKDLNSKMVDHPFAFNTWTYLDHYVYVLSMIYEKCGSSASMIVLGVNCNGRSLKDSSMYKSLQNNLPKQLIDLLDNSSLTTEIDENITEIQSAITDVITSQSFWGKEVPLKWMYIENALLHVRQRQKVIHTYELRSFFSADEQEMKRFLQFFNDIGLIIFFDEPTLKNSVIVDIDWFCGVFCHIITDILFSATKCSEHLIQLGIFSYDFMNDIWESSELCSQCQQKEATLLYMERLGLLVKGIDYYYVPFMNRTRFREEELCFGTANLGTPVITFQFDFLPTFFLSRFAVLLSEKHENHAILLGHLYQNAAFFQFENRQFAIVVDSSNTNLKILTDDQSLDSHIRLKIQKTSVEAMEENLRFIYNEMILLTQARSINNVSVSEEINTTYSVQETENKKTHPIMQSLKGNEENILKICLESKGHNESRSFMDKGKQTDIHVNGKANQRHETAIWRKIIANDTCQNATCTSNSLCGPVIPFTKEQEFLHGKRVTCNSGKIQTDTFIHMTKKNLDQETKNILENTNEILLKHKSTNTYIRTKQVDTVLKRLRKQQIVILTGKPGYGKSTIARQVLCELSEKDGCIPLIISDNSQMQKVIESEKKVIVYIEDIFGSTSFDAIAVEKWKNAFNLIIGSTNEGKISILISSRKNMITAARTSSHSHAFINPEYEVDLATHLLTREEKENIVLQYQELHKYSASELIGDTFQRYVEKYGKDTVYTLSDSEKQVIVKSEPSYGFAQTCSLFFGSKEFFQLGTTFFLRPNITLFKNIDDMRKSTDVKTKMRYFVLAYVFLEGSISINHARKDVFEEMCQKSMLQTWKEIDIKVAVQDLEGIYLSPNNQNFVYKFRHEAVKEAVAASFVKLAPDFVIQRCSDRIIEEFIRTEGCEARDGEVLLTFKKKYYPLLANRLMAFDALSIAIHPANKDPGFASVFFNVISQQCNNSNTLIKKLWDVIYFRDNPVLYSEILTRYGPHHFKHKTEYICCISVNECDSETPEKCPYVISRREVKGRLDELLHIGHEQSAMRVIKYVISNGDVNFYFHKYNISVCKIPKLSVLQCCIARGWIDVIDEMIHALSPSKTDDNFCLHVAAFFGQIELFKKIEMKTSTILETSREGYNILEEVLLGLRYGKRSSEFYLSVSDAYYNLLPLHNTQENEQGLSSMLQHLIIRYPSLISSMNISLDRYNNNVIHYLVIHDREEIYDILVNREKDLIHHRNDTDLPTTLHVAAYLGRVKFVEKLWKAGVRTGRKDLSIAESIESGKEYSNRTLKYCLDLKSVFQNERHHWIDQPFKVVNNVRIKCIRGLSVRFGRRKDYKAIASICAPDAHF